MGRGRNCMLTVNIDYSIKKRTESVWRIKFAFSSHWTLSLLPENQYKSLCYVCVVLPCTQRLTLFVDSWILRGKFKAVVSRPVIWLMNAQPITNSTLSSWVCKLPEAIAQKDTHTHIYICVCMCVSFGICYTTVDFVINSYLFYYRLF